MGSQGQLTAYGLSTCPKSTRLYDGQITPLMAKLRNFTFTIYKCDM